MKKIILLQSLAFALASAAQTPVTAPSIKIVDDRMRVDMELNLADIPCKSNQTVVLTPYLVNGADTLLLEPVGIYGRRNYIQYERGNFTRNVPQVAQAFKASKAPAGYNYAQEVSYRPWFDGATLDVRIERFGCAGCSLGDPEILDGISVWRAPKFNPALWTEYIRPEAEAEKIRHIEGRANVEFPLNKTILLDDFRGNYAELAKVRATIDTVRDDKNVTIKSMAIKGFASPEGSYSNNTRLAKGRTEALCAYVEQRYSLPKGFIAATFEPEDWQGLKEWVEASNIAEKEGILSVINDLGLEPDARDNRLKQRFPEQYAMLLNTVYPALRHSNYRIEYIVRSFSDPKEILEIMKTRPGNLSLDELFIASQSLEPGSPEFNEVFEIAVRMYPENEIANLNAATTAISRGDTEMAAQYLKKAGNSPTAVYARGLNAMLAKDYDSAETYLKEAAAQGVTRANELLNQLNQLRL